MIIAKERDVIHRLVWERYLAPALRVGEEHVSVRVQDVLLELRKKGNAKARTPMVCRVLLDEDLLGKHGLEIESVDGPASRQSRNVVVHYRNRLSTQDESNEQRAARLVGKLSGLLKEELAVYGGANGFIEWVRSDEPRSDEQGTA